MSMDLHKLWPPVFDAAIFDFDGTMAETSHIWREVDEAFLGARGIACTPEYARTLTVLGFEAGARYTIDTYRLKDSVEDVCAEWTRMGRALYKSGVWLRPGVNEYIRALRRLGIPCALATTNGADVLDTMEHVAIDALMDERVHGQEVGATKDEPDIYLEAARRLGVEPERCIVFEDIAPGIRAARSAGFMTCALKTEDPSQRWEEVRAEADLALLSWTDIDLRARPEPRPLASLRTRNHLRP